MTKIPPKPFKKKKKPKYLQNPQMTKLLMKPKKLPKYPKT